MTSGEDKIQLAFNNVSAKWKWNCVCSVLGHVCERRWIINQLLFVCFLWSATLTDETEDSRNHAFENTHTRAHTQSFHSIFYIYVSLPPLISRAKARVISFSSECCSARPWLGICLWLLLQPLQNLIRMRHTLTFSLFLCVALSCCFSSCIWPIMLS